MRPADFLREHAVGLAALAGFAALGAYTLREVQFEPPRVVYVATDPTKVDVDGSQPEEKPGRPRRVFDLDAARKAARTVPDILPPLVAPEPAPSVPAPDWSFAPGGSPAGKPLQIPLPAPGRR